MDLQIVEFWCLGVQIVARVLAARRSRWQWEMPSRERQWLPRLEQR